MNFSYGLGIDAGGTYTDAVVLDFDTGSFVLHSETGMDEFNLRRVK